MGSLLTDRSPGEDMVKWGTQDADNKTRVITADEHVLLPMCLCGRYLHPRDHTDSLQLSTPTWEEKPTGFKPATCVRRGHGVRGVWFSPNGAGQSVQLHSSVVNLQPFVELGGLATQTLAAPDLPIERSRHQSQQPA
ncbi:unnamed protein product [Boreogadus saida]